MVGLVAGGWMWLRMNTRATSDSELHREQRLLADFYANWIMAEIPLRLKRIQNDNAALEQVSREVFNL